MTSNLPEWAQLLVAVSVLSAMWFTWRMWPHRRKLGWRDQVSDRDSEAKKELADIEFNDEWKKLLFALLERQDHRHTQELQLMSAQYGDQLDLVKQSFEREKVVMEQSFEMRLRGARVDHINERTIDQLRTENNDLKAPINLSLQPPLSNEISVTPRPLGLRVEITDDREDVMVGDLRNRLSYYRKRTKNLRGALRKIRHELEGDYRVMLAREALEEDNKERRRAGQG